MHLKGEELSDKVIFLNGKRLAADVVELNTTDGWVDIELPVIPEAAQVKNQEVVAPDPEHAIKANLNRKRLFGKVQVAKLV